MRWGTGEATVERLIAAGYVERVRGAQADGASWLDRAPCAAGGTSWSTRSIPPSRQVLRKQQTLQTAAEIIDSAAKLVPNLGLF